MEASIERKQAAEELLRRRQLRSDLLLWAEHYGQQRGWKLATHHRLLLSKLQEVTDGRLIHSTTGDPCRNLMVLMPPGSAKSQNASVIFPPWALQRRPNSRFLACSYAADLIESFSRECRNCIQLYHKILGYNLMTDSRAIQEWSTTNGGVYRCGGVGAGISGRRADFGLVDDYLGSQEDADSKLMRDKQWQWYQADFWPRLKPNAIQVFVANRRHEDDLVGRLLEKQENKWEVIRIPFFAEEGDVLGRQLGERLWPEWYTSEMEDEIRQLPPRTQAGLYAQRPAPDEGNYFLRDWLLTYTREEYDKLNSSASRIYGAADWAVSEAKGSNRTCFGGVMLDTQGTIYVLPDLFWKCAGPKELITSLVDFFKRRNPLMFWSEKGMISKSLGPFLREAMLDADVFNYISEVTPVMDKETRAQSIRGRMSMLRVKFPGFASWWPQAQHELLTFPGGKNDDFVDFISHVGMGLGSLIKPSVTKHVEQTIDHCWKPTLKWLKKSDKERKQLKDVKYAGR